MRGRKGQNGAITEPALSRDCLAGAAPLGYAAERCPRGNLPGDNAQSPGSGELFPCNRRYRLCRACPCDHDVRCRPRCHLCGCRRREDCRPQERRRPIFEPGLDVLVRDNQAAGRLDFTTDPAVGVSSTGIILIAVGIPPDEDGSADLRHVLSVAEMVGSLMQDPKVIINKSTVPVGTADRVKAVVKARLTDRGLADLEFDVVSNPEFLKDARSRTA